VALSIARDRSEHELRNTLGECLRHTGDLIEAAQQFRESSRIAPKGYCAPMSNLGLVLESLSELEEAVAHYNAAKQCSNVEAAVEPDGSVAPHDDGGVAPYAPQTATFARDLAEKVRLSRARC